MSPAEFPWTWGQILARGKNRPARDPVLCARRKAERKAWTASRPVPVEVPKKRGRPRKVVSFGPALPDPFEATPEGEARLTRIFEEASWRRAANV